MGLRIGTANRGVLGVLRQIGITQRNLDTSLLRLSTGLRINHASDDPAGSFQAGRLRADIAGADSIIDSLTQTSNILDTADSALGEVSDLLSGIRASVVAAQGSLSAEELAAEQSSVDEAIKAIEAIAATSSYGTTDLLNSSSSIRTSAVSSALLDLQVNQADFGSAASRTFSLTVAAVGTRGTANVTPLDTNPVVAGGDATVRLTGPSGSIDLNVLNGTTGAQFQTAVNNVTGTTGIFAQTSGTSVDAYTADAGSSQTFTISQVGGAGTFLPGTLTGTGTDLTGTLDSANVAADGNFVTAVSSDFHATFLFDEAAGAGAYAFTASRSGIQFTLNPGSGIRTAVGLPFADPANLGSPVRSYGLGTIGGFLNTLRSGGANDLSTNPDNALGIVDDAISDVSLSRSKIGSVVSNLLEPIIDVNGATRDNLDATRSLIEDLDFARETAEYTRNQILQQAQVATLSSFNLQNSKVLELLVLPR